MAMSTCPKCDSTLFEMKEIEPRNSNYKYNAIQCSICGAVVGIVDYDNIGQMIDDLAKKLGVYL